MPIVRAAIYQPEARDEPVWSRIERLQAQLEKAGPGVIDILLCPELFLSGYDIGSKVIDLAETRDGQSLERLSKVAAKYETALAIGYPERAGESLYNAVAVIGKSGERLLDYRKQALPPGYEGDVFTPGEGSGAFDFMGCRVAVLICYDVEFPELVREAALDGADIILTPTALRAKWTFVAQKMIPTRAFENGLFLLYANHAGQEGDSDYLGGSVIVAPNGEALVLAGAGEELISCDLDMQAIAEARKTLPYVTDVKERKRLIEGSVPQKGS